MRQQFGIYKKFMINHAEQLNFSIIEEYEFKTFARKSYFHLCPPSLMRTIG